MSRFALRLCEWLQTIKINQDYQDLSRHFNIIKKFLGTSSSKILTNWEILIEKNDKINSLLIKIETNCEDWPKILSLNGFLDLDWDFWDWKVVLRRNRDFSIETYRSLRSNFWKCQDFLDCRDKPLESVKIETLNRDTIETNRGPQPYLLALEITLAVKNTPGGTRLAATDSDSRTERGLTNRP